MVELAAAFEAGETVMDNNPPTSATTAVCAMRFSRDVFVDIDFLSFSRLQVFPKSGRDT
jgi:hypothetical protein